MEQKKRTLRINEIRRAASKIPGVPGNLIINGEWFSSRELRNALIGMGLSADIPVTFLRGATISFTTLKVTPEDIAASPEGVKHTVNGKEITFKKAGDNNIGLTLDLSGLNLTDSDLKLAELSKMFPRENRGVRPAAAPVAQPAETIVDEHIGEEAEAGMAHENLAEGAAETPAEVPAEAVTV